MAQIRQQTEKSSKIANLEFDEIEMDVNGEVRDIERREGNDG
jgi:hypothetical protein